MQSLNRRINDLEDQRELLIQKAAWTRGLEREALLEKASVLRMQIERLKK